jgi:hypothetical protein
MPVITQDLAYSWVKGEAPAELAPLLVLISIVAVDAGGRPANSCVTVCYQFARSLQLLGFDAELLVACASVFSKRIGEDTKITDVGTWDREPRFDVTDHSYTGHLVVYSPSFRRLVDPTIAQDFTVQRKFAADPKLGLPLMGTVPDDVELTKDPILVIRGDHLISYMLWRDRLPTLDPFWDNDELVTSMEQAALTLAHMILERLRTLEQVNMQRWRQTWPNLRPLLDGERQLPEAEELSAYLRPWESLMRPS